MLSLETILEDTIWVGKYYFGGRIKGKYNEIAMYQDEFRDFDIACLEGQPDYLKEFYEGYFSQRKYFIIQDYYENVYKVNNTLHM